MKCRRLLNEINDRLFGGEVVGLDGITPFIQGKKSLGAQDYSIRCVELSYCLQALEIMLVIVIAYFDLSTRKLSHTRTTNSKGNVLA
jgi:hypothetical protein